MFITLILITITALVILLQLILSMNGVDINQFNMKVGFFAMMGIIVLVMCMVGKYLGRRTTFYSLLITGAISLILMLFMWGKGIYMATIPFLLLAVGAASYKIIKSVNPKSIRASINGIAPHLVHLGVVFIIIGFIGSNFFTTEEEITLYLNGNSERMGDYELKLVDVKSSQDSMYAVVEISRNGDVVGKGEPGLLLIDYGGGQQLRSEIDVIGVFAEDIYLTYNHTVVDNDLITGVNLHVKTLPLMSVLWAGMWLMVLGIGARAVVEHLRPKKKTKPKAEEEGKIAVEDEKTTEYYDALIEKELEEMG